LTEKLEVDIAVEADLFILEYRLKKFMEKFNIDIPSALLVARELATNILKYGKKGFIEVKLKEDGLCLVAEDIGKADGDNGEKRPAGGLGIGLEVVKKSSNEFEIERKPSGGTRVKATLKASNQKGKNFVLQVGTASKPHYLEEESGDVCVWKKMGEKYMLFVADVLGHGRKAYEVAKVIELYVKNSTEGNIDKIYADLERLVRGTRGCVAFVALVSESMIEYINVGNIKAWIVDAGTVRRTMGVSGVIGRMPISLKIFKEPISLLHSTLVVCTDGIKNQFIPSPDMDWIRTLSPRDVALKIIKEFSIKEDDATVLVARGGNGVMTNLKGFMMEYKNYLAEYILKGGQDEILFEAYQHLIKLLDDSSAQAANILDIHNQVLKDVLNIKQDNDMVQWIYIERATEFLAQILIATDALLLSLKESVERDPLTGLYNRLAIDRILSKVWLNTNMTKTPLTVAMLDLDDFKHVNDKYGHLIGDELLKEVSTVIKACLRDKDVVMRYGGEEFLILLPETEIEGAKKALERVRKKIEEGIFTEAKIKATASIGAAVYPDDRPLSMEEIVKFADAALYAAKAKGKNRLVFYSHLNKQKD